MRLQARVTFNVYDDSECGPDDTDCEPIEFDEDTFLYGHDVGNLGAVEEILMDLQAMLDDNPNLNSFWTDIPLGTVAKLVGREIVPSVTYHSMGLDGAYHAHERANTPDDTLDWTSAEDAFGLPIYCPECGGYLVPGAGNHRHIRRSAA